MEKWKTKNRFPTFPPPRFLPLKNKKTTAGGLRPRPRRHYRAASVVPFSSALVVPSHSALDRAYVNAKDTVDTADGTRGKNALLDRAPKVYASGLAGEEFCRTRGPPRCIWKSGSGVVERTAAEYRSKLRSKHRAPRRGIVQCLMPKKIVALPLRESSSRPVAERWKRMLFRIGRRRFAFDFHSKVTELRQDPGEVIPLHRPRRRKPKNQQS